MFRNLINRFCCVVTLVLSIIIIYDFEVNLLANNTLVINDKWYSISILIHFCITIYCDCTLMTNDQYTYKLNVIPWQLKDFTCHCFSPSNIIVLYHSLFPHTNMLYTELMSYIILSLMAIDQRCITT